MQAMCSAALAAVLLTTPVFAEDLAARAADSRAAAQAFMKQLKGELQAAMKAGGPVQAIEVCNLRAPEIADRVSKAQGFEVARTSLKYRNPNNAPDSWEQAVLERFEARRAAGEDPAKLEFYEVTTGPGGAQEFRYMKAIPTGELCLACHGTDIKAPVKAKLDALYPGDRARGYALGQIRGAFTIRQPR